MSNLNENKTIFLTDMPTGSRCIIIKVSGHGGLRHRLMEMGFVRGETVTVIKNAPLLDPVEYQVMQAHVSLRRSEADKIEVVPIGENINIHDDFNGMMEDDVYVNDRKKSDEIKEKSNNISVALIGNPNCGKTSFFNHATGLREKVEELTLHVIELQKQIDAQQNEINELKAK